MIGRREFLLAAALLPKAGVASVQAAVDRSHVARDSLLKRSAWLICGGNARQVGYRGMAAGRAPEQPVCGHPAQHAGWSQAKRFAFLVNACDASTVGTAIKRHRNLASKTGRRLRHNRRP